MKMGRYAHIFVNPYRFSKSSRFWDQSTIHLPAVGRAIVQRNISAKVQRLSIEYGNLATTLYATKCMQAQRLENRCSSTRHWPDHKIRKKMKRGGAATLVPPAVLLCVALLLFFST